MGKKTKKKLKWTNLEIETKTGKKHLEENSHKNEQNQTHPFLKIISKNLDVILKKESINTDEQDPSEETKFVYLYRSDQTIPVPNPEDPNSYTGAPIQYTFKPTPQNTQKSQDKPVQDYQPPTQQTTQDSTMQEYHHSGLDTQYSVESTQSLGSVNWEDQISPVQNQAVYYYQPQILPVHYSGQSDPHNPYHAQATSDHLENQSGTTMKSTASFAPPTTYTHQPIPSNHGLTTYPTCTQAPIYNSPQGNYCQPVVETTISQPITYVPHPAYAQPAFNPPTGLTTYTQATSNSPTTTTFSPPFLPQVPFTPNNPPTYLISAHPIVYHPHTDPSQHQPLPLYLPPLPQELQNQNVQYVPYYYYYPVPVASQPVQTETVELPPNISAENLVCVESDITSSPCSCQDNEEDPMEACDPGSAYENSNTGNYCHAHIPISQICASSSTTSCESCNILEKSGRTLKKRKKRRKQLGAEKKLNEDNDSGYLNGTESSKNCSDQEQEQIKNSEKKSENIEAIDVVIETICELGNLIVEKQKENSQPITDQFIEQIQDPTSEFAKDPKSLQESYETPEAMIHPILLNNKEEKREDLEVNEEKKGHNLFISDTSEETINEAYIDEKIAESMVNQKKEEKSNKTELTKLSEKDAPKSEDKLSKHMDAIEIEKTIIANTSICPILSYSAVCQKGQINPEVKEVKTKVEIKNSDAVTKCEEVKTVINQEVSTSDWKEVSVNKRISGRKKNKGAQNTTINVSDANCKINQKEVNEVMDNKKNDNNDTELTKRVQFKDVIMSPTITSKQKKVGNSKNIQKTSKPNISIENDNIIEPSISPTEKVLLNEKCQNDSKSESLPPLSDVKDIFWKEKEVEIIELKTDKSQKSTNKKRKSNKHTPNNKTISIMEKQNRFSNESSRVCQETDKALIKELENLNLPLLVIRPSDTHTPMPHQTPAQYPKCCNKINCSSYCSIPIFPWHCVDESLINSKLGRRDYSQKPECDKKVILIRDQNPLKALVKQDQGAQKYKKENVPGPRLQYTTGDRTGPLGVTRKVVPPLSLIHRLNSF